MSAIAKFTGGMPVAIEDLEKGLANVAATIQGSTGGVPLLRLLKAGYFVYGPENIETEENSQWAVNPYSITHGYACWGDGVLLGEVMVPFTQAPPTRGDLADFQYEWRQQVAAFLQCTSGEDTGTTVLCKGTSVGWHNAFKELVSAIANQLRTDKINFVPIVELTCDSYQHKKHGQVFYPVLKLVGFSPMSSPEISQPEPEPEVEPDEPDVEQEEEAPAPPPRRRGGKAATAPAPASRRRRRGA